MSRTTRAQLDDMAAGIGEALGEPGSHDIDVAYGSPRLTRNGGSVEVSPRLPAGQLMDWMRAYRKGIYHGRRALMTEAAQGIYGDGPVVLPGFDAYGNRTDEPVRQCPSGSPLDTVVRGHHCDTAHEA